MQLAGVPPRLAVPVSRRAERPADAFADPGPHWFASVMGGGIVAAAGATLPVQWPGLRGFAAAIWVRCALWLIASLAVITQLWQRMARYSAGWPGRCYPGADLTVER